MTMVIDTRGAGGTAMGPNEAKLIMALTQDDASLEQTRRALAEVRSELGVIQDELSRTIAPQLEDAYPSAGGHAAAEATRKLGDAVHRKLAEVDFSILTLDRVRRAYAAAEARRSALPPVGLPPVPSAAAREEMADGALGPAYRAHRAAVVAHEAAKEAREASAAEAFGALEGELSSSATEFALELGYGQDARSDGETGALSQGTAAGAAGGPVVAGGLARAGTPAIGGVGAAQGAPVPGERGVARVPGAIGPVVPRDVVHPAPNANMPGYLPDGRPAVDGSSAPVGAVVGEDEVTGVAGGDIGARSAAPGGVVAGSTAAAGAGLVGLVGGSALLGGGALAGAGAAPVRGPVSNRLGGTPPRGVAGPGGAIRGPGSGAPVTARPAGSGAAVPRPAGAGAGAAAARPAGTGAAHGPRAMGGGTSAAAGRTAGDPAVPRPAGAGASGQASARPPGVGTGAAATRGGASPAAARPTGGGGAATASGGAATDRSAGSSAATARPAGGGAATGRPVASAAARPSGASVGAPGGRGAGVGGVRSSTPAPVRAGDARTSPTGAGSRGALGAVGGGARGGAAGSGGLAAAGGARGREESEKDGDAVDLGEDWLDGEGMLGDGVIR